MFLIDPPRTPWDLNFAMFGIPVRVHPFFWLCGLLLGMNSGTPTALAAWIVAFFFSILIHELGHAFAMLAYRQYPWIVLYGLGGMTSYNPAMSRLPDALGQIVISFAGPLAGFVAAALLAVGLSLAGHPVRVVIVDFLPMVVFGGLVLSEGFTYFIYVFLIISVFWGFINLLPIYPLDGGQIARVIFLRLNPYNGLRYSLMLSFVLAVLLAVISLLQWQNYFSAFFFGYLAFSSYAMLASASGRGPW